MYSIVIHAAGVADVRQIYAIFCVCRLITSPFCCLGGIGAVLDGLRVVGVLVLLLRGTIVVVVRIHPDQSFPPPR